MSDNIKVVVKVRPLIARELDERAAVLWRARNNTLHQLDSTGRDILPGYTFDKVYDAESETKAVYDDIARPIVEAATAGINGTIFAYGQTSSGKTYTMLGDENSPGIIPLAVHDIFQRIKNIPSRDFLLRVSYIEIYNETIKDLLNDTKEKIKVFETVDGSVKVDATEKVTATPEEVLDIMKKGEVNRQVGATNMNEQSSRSHTIFQITIESREHTEGEEEAGCTNVSQLNLVDLAGSERSGQTGATGQRFREGTHINKSLSALGLVIKQLSDDPNKYVNYRDSKLTRILQNSLGGNAKTSIICAVTPAAVEETISTLQFANRAKAIKNKPEVNAVATNATMLQSLTKKLASLQYELDNKKHLEHDNEKLTRKIETLQKQILFGMERPAERGSRRKTWCAPRRATIAALPPIQEEAGVALRFCTPSLKYNSSLQPESMQFVTERRASDIAEGSEEEAPVTPPRRRNVAFTGEVITLDDSDEEAEKSEETCSPYHHCYATSKTPPCVLRDQVKKAEHSYMDLIELTEREKIYSPQTVELMDRLDKNSLDLRTIKDDLDEAKKQCEEKDKEIKLLQEKVELYENEVCNKSKVECEEKLKEIYLLKHKIETNEREIEEGLSIKIDLEALCASYKTRLTDLEVSLESCKIKAKQREIELLSLLEDKGERGTSSLSDKFEKLPASEISAFMNLSKDISLVDGDIETSNVSTYADKLPCNENSKVLQAQINENNDLISELYKKINNGQQSITIYKNELELSNTERSTQQATIDKLLATIDSLNMNLSKSEEQISSYNKLVSELKHILSNEYETEQKLSCNNISDIISSLKTTLESKNNEINTLKIVKSDKCSKHCQEIVFEKKKKIAELEEEILELKQIHEIKSDLLQINDDLIEKNNLLSTDYVNAVKRLDEMNQDLSSLKTLNSNKDDQIRELIVLQQHLNSSLIEQKQLRNNTISENAALDAKLKQHNVKISEMSSQLQDLINLKECLTSEVAKLQTEIISQNRELTAAIHMSDMMNIKNEELNIKLSNLELDGHKLKEQIIQKQCAIDVLELTVQEANDKLAKVIEKEKTEINNILQILHMHIQKLKENNNKILFDVITDISETVDEDHQEITLCKCIDTLNGVFAKTHDKYIQIKQSHSDLETAITSLSKNINEQKQEWETERIQQNQNILKLKNCQARVLELNEKYCVMESENTKLNVKIQCLLNTEDELKEAISQKECEIKCLIGNEEKIKMEAIWLKQQLCENNKELQNVEVVMDKYDQEIIAYKKCIEEVDILKNEQNSLKGIKSQKELEFNALIKANKQSNDNSEKHSVTYKENENEQFVFNLMSSFENNETLSELQNKIISQEKEVIHLQNICADKTQEICKLIELNRDANNNLTANKNFIDLLSKELFEKANKIGQLYFKQLSSLDEIISQKLAHFDHSIHTIEESIKVLCKSKKSVFNPVSLIELSLKQVDEHILKGLNWTNMQKQTQITKQTTYPCNSIQLEQQNNENRYLMEQINILQNANEKLESDRNQVNAEIKLLLEPADHLYKQIMKHRTHLSTLTATTYAENKLLKTRVKALSHHHDRLHKFCQREIHELREQLQSLQEILQSEFNIVSPLEALLNQPSIDKKQCVNDPSEININDGSSSKHSATLDSDALMLETNFTLGPSANSTMISHEGIVDASVTMCENLDMTEIPRNVNTGCQTDMQVLQDGLDLHVNHKHKNFRACCFNLNESRAELHLIEPMGPFDLSACVPSNQLLEDELKLHSSYCIIKKEYNILLNLLKTTSKETEDLFSIINSLRLEKSDEIKKKSYTIQLLKTEISELRSENEVLTTQVINNKQSDEIKKLSCTVQSLKKEISELQSENESLSTQVMDNILENDALKEELMKTKDEKVKLNECNECLVKVEIISSLKRMQDTDNVLRESKKSNNSLNTLSPVVTENSLRHDKICSLHNELMASQEDCRKINEDVSTMRSQLSRNETLSMEMEHTLKSNSVFEKTSNIELSISNEKCVDENYASDKSECLNFLIDKEICTKSDVFDMNKPIFEMIKCLYDTLCAKHANEVENLVNKLKHLEVDKVAIQNELNSISSENEIINEQLKHEVNFHNKLSKKLYLLKENDNFLIKEIRKFDFLQEDINMKYVSIFSEKMLQPIDEEFALSTSEVFKKIMSSLHTNYHTDLLKSNKKCAELEQQANACAQELTDVNAKVLSMKSELLKNEEELVQLKSQNDNMYQISNAVTKDLLVKEKMLKKVVSENYNLLINQNIISKEGLDTSLPIIEILEQMFSCMTIKYQSDVKTLLDTQKTEVDDLKKENIGIKERIQMLTSELLQKNEELLNLNSVNSQYSTQLVQNESLTKLLQDANNVHKENKEKFENEMIALKQNLLTSESKISHLEREVVGEALKKINALESECITLKSLNAILIEENKDLNNKLDIGKESLESSKKEFDQLNNKFNEVQEANVSLLSCIKDLKKENVTQTEELMKFNLLLKERSKEFSLLEKNLKTHQKATDIQTSMYKRLQKEYEEIESALKEKLNTIEQLTERCDALQSQLMDSNSVKDTLEHRIADLQNQVDKCQQSGQNVLETVKTETRRRRRQSIHDLQRTFADINENTFSEEHPEEIFGNLPPVANFFPDSAPGSQRNSMDSEGKRERRSVICPNMEYDEGQESRGSGTAAQARRRRRQSLHDQHRLSASRTPLGSQEDISIINDLRSENKSLKDKIDHLMATTESGSLTDDYYKGEIASLQRELECCREQHAELQVKYRELDEECDTCADYLRERDAQCLQLSRTKKALELQLTEMSKRLGGGDTHGALSRQQINVAVNTDGDWSKLHSAMVDRMSYDAEIEKSKKLAKAIEVLRSKNTELTATIEKVQEQIASCRPSEDNVRELEKLRSELTRCQREYEALQRRYAELDEECDTCATYLREREEQNIKLSREKKALEAKLTELQKKTNEVDITTQQTPPHPLAISDTTSSMVQSTRKKRQSCHDMNRAPDSTTADVATNTDGGALSALGVDLMTHEAERERARRLQAALDTLKARNSELGAELRRLQLHTRAEENTVEMLQPSAALDRALLSRQTTEIQQLRSKVGELMARNTMLEQLSRSLPPSPAPHLSSASLASPAPAPTLLAPPPPIFVATGSAIVQNQQLCELMRDNQRLKKMNAKLMNLCKKRVKPEPDANRDNEEPR